MKIMINNILISSSDFTAPDGGKATTSVSITVEEDFRVSKVQNQYRLTGQAYQIVYNLIINNPNGKNTSIPVKIYEDKCCDPDVLLFDGIIRGDMVDWCYAGPNLDCSCTVTMQEQTMDTMIADCLQSTVIWDDFNNFTQQNHPKMVYCVEFRPDILAYFLLANAAALSTLLQLLSPIVFIISVMAQAIDAIVNAINTLIPGSGGDIPWNNGGFDGNASTTLFQEFQNGIDRINQALIGCGRKHPSPLIRQYVQNACSKCSQVIGSNITFQSSIFTDPQSDYYNTVLFNANSVKGTRNPNQPWISENAPLMTLKDLLDKLKPVFNGNYDIVPSGGGFLLRFERKDFFWTGNPMVNYNTLLDANRIKDQLCLSWRDEDRPSYANFKYVQDGIDTSGDEALYRYNDIVEWNQPYSSLQKGKKEVFLEFGVPRFRDDGIDVDILGMGWFDELGTFGAGTVWQTIQQHQGVLILHKHIAAQPKLLIWDGQNNFFGKVKNYNPPGFFIQGGEFQPPGLPTINLQSKYYNFPYYFNEHNSVPNTSYPTNHPNSGLYPRFWSIENPKLIIDRGLEFTFSFYFDCATLSTVRTEKYVQLPEGQGRITSITVNLDDNSITITGNV